MIIKVYRDELYPYYVLNDVGYEGVWTDLPQETVEWLETTIKEFAKAQDLLGAIYNGNYA